MGSFATSAKELIIQEMNATIEKEDTKKNKLDLKVITLNHIKLLTEENLVKLTM